MKRQLSESKIAKRDELVEFISETTKKLPQKKAYKPRNCRIIYFRHANEEEDDYTYGFI